MIKKNPHDFFFNAFFPNLVAKHLGGLYILFCSASLGPQLYVCRWYGGLSVRQCQQTFIVPRAPRTFPCFTPATTLWGLYLPVIPI